MKRHYVKIYAINNKSGYIKSDVRGGKGVDIAGKCHFFIPSFLENLTPVETSNVVVEKYKPNRFIFNHVKSVEPIQQNKGIVVFDYKLEYIDDVEYLPKDYVETENINKYDWVLINPIKNHVFYYDSTIYNNQDLEDEIKTFLENRNGFIKKLNNDREIAEKAIQEFKSNSSYKDFKFNINDDTSNMIDYYSCFNVPSIFSKITISISYKKLGRSILFKNYDDLINTIKKNIEELKEKHNKTILFLDKVKKEEEKEIKKAIESGILVRIKRYDKIEFVKINRSTIEVPKWAMGFLIGRGGKNIKDVQNKTNLNINLKPYEEDYNKNYIANWII